MKRLRPSLNNSLTFPYVAIILFAAFVLGCNSGSQDVTQSEESQAVPSAENPLFTELDAAEIGIDFFNELVLEEEHMNMVNYTNIFNGGGVAVGDINNDGLLDLYLTGSMVTNKLYLNIGDFKFKDITESAGVDGGEHGWCTGVTMVDINNDGYLDIYVCRAFNKENPELRENLLYVNNQDQTFTERAKEYGINDNGYANQATFLDYNLDGHIDLFIGNHPPKLLHDVEYRISMHENPPMELSDKLFRNNGNGTFTNVTAEAGVLSYGFVLGVVAGDVNNDGWPDIYLAIDHAEPDILYINNQDGTFTDRINESFKHIANFGMGIDIADFNNDGLLDIIEVDMMAKDNYRQKTQMSAMAPDKFWELVDIGWHHQYMRNNLQLNNGNGTFSEVGQYAGVSNTDWSWSALLADFDNDGHKDLYISNGYRKDIRDNDFIIAIKKLVEEKTNNNEKIDYNFIESTAAETKLSNYYFKNNGDLTFSDKSHEYGMGRPGFSYGVTYGDMDNDGDLDLIVTNLADPPFIYKNNANELYDNNYLDVDIRSHTGDRFGFGTKVIIKIGDMIQFQELTLTRGFQSSVTNRIHFGVGTADKVDEVKISWLDGKQQIISDVEVNQVLLVEYKNAERVIEEFNTTSQDLLFTDISDNINIDFVHLENKFDDYVKEILLPHKMSQFGPNLAIGDVNNDGYEDFYVGGASWQSGKMYVQQPDGSFTESLQGWVNDKVHEDLGALLFDSDNDGDLDLYVVSGGNEFSKKSQMLQDRLYLNDGYGNFTLSSGRIPKMINSGSCVVAGDYDKDGDLDLFVGGRLIPGKYPFPPRSYILNNNGGVFSDVTKDIAPEMANQGLATSAVWTDFNMDGQLDIIVVGEWMPVTFYQNDNNKFINKTEDFGFINTTGWWNKIIAADFDGDGDEDYVIGNIGLNTKFSASVEEPLNIYCHDFDESGNLDIVLGYYNDGTCFPVRGRQCSSQQMPFITEKFKTYDEFGHASIEDVYGEDLGEALHYAANEFASSYIENKGNGNFDMRPLPAEAQFSTVFGLVAQDFDEDGSLDILLAGNFYAPEVETGRNDASIGLYMKGNGKGRFLPVNVMESGFFAELDVKDMAVINKTVSGSPLVLVANNNDRLQIFRINSKQESNQFVSK